MHCYKRCYKIGKWVKVPGYCTPGGDAVYKCSICGEDEHVFGVEHLKNQHERCKKCGSFNKYT